MINLSQIANQVITEIYVNNNADIVVMGLAKSIRDIVQMESVWQDGRVQDVK
jgi:hypothetical protein